MKDVLLSKSGLMISAGSCFSARGRSAGQSNHSGNSDQVSGACHNTR
ncbi:hypothetical protein CLOSTMETH_00298 [[Clostridium] methylpentosum DSM 5476]|uniref:Uncharacterized protein n=1 Tax=[Clostridium] methylpentosum DSM 5476 TaxID=537013 RepID=C0E902_9FIRM|nr:hypothetical protein CLOSTMETH_00298 [[Clostridium] methylpentosum DSM 5476]